MSGSPMGISRRKFLAGFASLLAGSVVVLWGPTSAGASAPSVASKQEQGKWLALGPLSRLIPGLPMAFPFSRTTRDAWGESVENGVVYAITHDGQSVRAFSNLCTHHGCRVSWSGQKKVFVCPCHEALFDVDGQVVAGPPTRPLDCFQTRIEDGRVQILLEA
jgi:nitrite reductase/ring-hydroxylating ferredoxin subunit